MLTVTYKNIIKCATLIFIFAIAFLVSATPVQAAACPKRCWVGQDISQSNWGSQANINMPVGSISVPSGTVSFIFVNSYVRDGLTRQHFVQTGWGYTSNCVNNRVYGYSEWTEYVSQDPHEDPNYHAYCLLIAPNTRHNFYQEFNGSYWCRGIDGNVCLGGGIYPVVNGAPNNVGRIAMTGGSYVAAYGEVSDTSDTMGGVSEVNAAVMQPVTYKATNGTAINSSFSGSGYAYASCGISPCPYSKRVGFSGTPFNLYVKIWTN